MTLQKLTNRSYLRIIANKYLGRTNYYKILIMNDKTAQEALKYFNEAKTLLN